MADQETRQMVKSHLDDLLGTEVSRGLLDMIPDKDELATKADLEVTAKVLRAEITALGGELRGEMAELRGEMAELRGEMGDLGSEVRQGFAALNSRFDAQDALYEGRFAKQDARFAKQDANLKAQTSEIVTTLTYRLWSSMVAVATLIFAGQGIALAWVGLN